jgi:hypothetical protein
VQEAPRAGGSNARGGRERDHGAERGRPGSAAAAGVAAAGGGGAAETTRGLVRELKADIQRRHAALLASREG